MVVLELPLIAQPHHPQHRRHRPLARRQDRPHHQHLDPVPDPLAEHILKHAQHAYNLCRQGFHGSPFLASGV